MSLADRIAVLDAGRVQQVDTPVELYQHPRSRFVAGFVGANNVFSGRLMPSGGLDVPGVGVLPAPAGKAARRAAGRLDSAKPGAADRT
ncbi:hypothetical protein [Streptomyces sp. BRA346]|uniref:hypothetical protein n=1 Tax=Streptomyces sp. BRA346 TaxID=2878199 RepID=UPI0040631E0D